MCTESIAILILILIAEYVGDFLLQDRDVAARKSKEFSALFTHAVYLFISLSVVSLFVGSSMILFAIVYTAIHAFQDHFIWRIYYRIIRNRFSREVEAAKIKGNKYTDNYVKNQVNVMIANFTADNKYAEDKVFYDIIGLDRLLHVTTIVILWRMFFVN